MSEITIKITNKDDYISLTKEENGLKSTKYVTLNDLLSLLSNVKEDVDLGLNKKDKLLKHKTDILPSNNGVSIIQHMESYSDLRYVVLKKEACKHDFFLYDNKFEKVGLPTLLFILIINESNYISSGYLFATKDNFIKETTKIYHYPFPNVGYDGLICFGGNRKNLFVENLYDLHTFPSKFLFMPTTHELSTRYSSNIELRPLLELLQNKDFNYDLLEPIGYTYGGIINKITK